MIYKAHGKLAWSGLFAPSIKLAQEGWLLDDLLADRINSSAVYILADRALSRVFAPNGTVLMTGDIIKRPRFAETLKQISLLGVDAFYTV